MIHDFPFAVKGFGGFVKVKYRKEARKPKKPREARRIIKKAKDHPFAFLTS